MNGEIREEYRKINKQEKLGKNKQRKNIENI